MDSRENKIEFDLKTLSIFDGKMWIKNILLKIIFNRLIKNEDNDIKNEIQNNLNILIQKILSLETFENNKFIKILPPPTIKFPREKPVLI